MAAQCAPTRGRPFSALRWITGFSIFRISVTMRSWNPPRPVACVWWRSRGRSARCRRAIRPPRRVWSCARSQIGCPTHIDIPGYLELIAQGQNREAARLVKEVLPFPYILGLTCPAPCQDVCRRGLVEEEIAICRMHGYAAEQCMDDPPTPWVQEATTGKKVAIVGAGPCGLTAAYYLALKGHYC